jgi:hypothetical protein
MLPTVRWRCHIDAYTMSGLFGSSTTSAAPVCWLTVSTAFHVWPPSVVLYTPRSPPDDQSGPCEATYTTLELRGSILMLPMCSEFARPTRVHVAPASVDLYKPSPIIALRGTEFSPVPSHRMFEFFGSTTMQQRLNAPPESKIGVNVCPRFVDFHNPPAAAAT